jgi:hypothetical protein
LLPMPEHPTLVQVPCCSKGCGYNIAVCAFKVNSRANISFATFLALTGMGIAVIVVTVAAGRQGACYAA